MARRDGPEEVRKLHCFGKIAHRQTTFSETFPARYAASAPRHYTKKYCFVYITKARVPRYPCGVAAGHPLVTYRKNADDLRREDAVRLDEALALRKESEHCTEHDACADDQQDVRLIADVGVLMNVGVHNGLPP